MIPERILLKAKLCCNKQRFWCFLHKKTFKIDKLLVCDVKNCKHYIKNLMIKKNKRLKFQ
jgi:hypothetical protein